TEMDSCPPRWFPILLRGRIQEAPRFRDPCLGRIRLRRTWPPRTPRTRPAHRRTLPCGRRRIPPAEATPRWNEPSRQSDRDADRPLGQVHEGPTHRCPESLHWRTPPSNRLRGLSEGLLGGDPIWIQDQA